MVATLESHEKAKATTPTDAEQWHRGRISEPGRDAARQANTVAHLAVRDAVIGAMDASPFRADVVGEHLGVCSDTAYSWRKPGDTKAPDAPKLWRMLTEPRVLDASGHRVLVRTLASAGGFEVVFPDGVGLDKDPAHVQVLDIAARLGALSAAIRAAGAKVDTAAERAAVAGPLDELIREALELKKSVEK